MANNRLCICEIDDSNNIVAEMIIAKHFGGSWFIADYQGADTFVDKLNDFFETAFINGNGISLKDEFMDVPLPAIYNYNDEYEGMGEWTFKRQGG